MSSRDRATVAIIFHRFGPYHVARLAAAAQLFDVLAIEEVAETSEYAWDVVGQPEVFRRTTLLSSGERPANPAREIASRIEQVLNTAAPSAIAVPGWSDPAALAALRWGLRHNIPAIVMSESTVFDEPRRAWKEWLKRRVVRQCAAGLVGGEPHAEYLTDLGISRERIFPGYDAVDNMHFTVGAQRARADPVSLRPKLGLPEKYFLASSRFVPQKNLPMLLSAYAAYRRNAGVDAWKLVLLGDGSLLQTLTEQITALDVVEDVFLPGFKQYAELPAYYGLAGAFVHASTKEPWGLVVNEAMAAGLPVLVSERCGCARDLVSDGENGWTFRPDDPGALTALFTKLATSSPSRLAAMGEAGRRRIEGWSPAAFAANLDRAVQAAHAHPTSGLGMLDRLLFAVLLRRSESEAARLLPRAPVLTSPPHPTTDP